MAVSKATALQAFADLTKKIPGHPVVTAQELDRQLEKFHLIDDGDNTEQHLWLLLRDDFPNYELFWRKYVVPVTLRLRSDLPHEKRIRLRPAAKYFEPMAMAHYSVFYYLGYAIERIRTAQPDDRLLANDAFSRLDSSIDNVQHFFDAVSSVAADLGVKNLKLGQIKGGENAKPKDKRKKPSAIREIIDYRDTLLHNPVIGRGVTQGVEKLPVYARLEEAKKSWFSSEKISDSDRVETITLLDRLRREYCAYLNSKWLEIITALDKKRDKCVDLMRLDEPDAEYINVSMPWAASGYASIRSDVHPLPIIIPARKD